MSTAIDDLRSMLDERHVKWRTDTSVTNKVEWTIWKSPWFKEVWAKEVDGSISIFNCSMTPAQAIEATLGRGECEAEVEVVEFSQMQEIHRFTCSECGESFGAEEHGGLFGLVLDKVKLPNYCPNCGRRIEVDA